MRLIPETANRKDWPRLVAQAIRELQKPVGGLNFVANLADLPAAVGGVHTLEDNTAYWFTGTVDLEGGRLVCGQNTVLLGSSSENCRVKSTGLTGTALVSSEWSIPIRSIAFEADVALNLDATGNANQAIDWFGVNFTDCNTVGLIKNYGNVIWTDCGVLNSDGLTFDGSIGTVGLNSSIFTGTGGGTTVVLPSTLTITRRFRVIYCAFVAFGGQTAIDASTSAVLPIEGYILDTCNFSGGATYTAGVPSDDNKALWTDCRGITNSDTVGTMYMQENVTATTIGAVSTPVKIAGATIEGANNQRFAHTPNRLSYEGARARDFKVTVTCTLVNGGSNNEYGFYIAKNGAVIDESEQYVTASTAGRVESVALQAIIAMEADDYLEIFVENTSGTANVTVSFLNVIAVPAT